MNLKNILNLHLSYLRAEKGGVKADLMWADLMWADLMWADLSGAILSGADLRRADLRFADLNGANLNGANLRYANLMWADLMWADLRRADLSYVDLRRADLRYADLSGADLRRANLNSADLNGADLDGANLDGADLRNTCLKEPAMTAYKLTDKQGFTQGGTKWGPGITHRAQGLSTESCSDGVIHYYESLPLALLVNPLHVNFCEPIAWEVEVAEPLGTDGLHSWARQVTTIRKVESPVVTLVNRRAFGILCSMKVFADPKFVIWGTNWLNGTDRTKESALARAAWAVRDAARSANSEAANSAEEAVYATMAPEVPEVSYASSSASSAVAAAASWAALARAAINFIAIAEKAMLVK